MRPPDNANIINAGLKGFNMIAHWKEILSSENRNLIKELVIAQFKHDDHNSAFGMLWSLLEPLIMLLVTYFIFSSRFGAKIKEYPLYLLIGIIFTNFFITASTTLVRSLVANREIILNSAILRENFILTSLFIHLYKFMIEVVICFFLSAWFSSANVYSILLLVPILAAYVAFVIGVGFIFSILYCFLNDIYHIWLLFSRLIFFITPVFYALENLSRWARAFVYYANPLTVYLISAREILLKGKIVNTQAYVLSLLFGFSFFMVTYLFFMRLSPKAVENI